MLRHISSAKISSKWDRDTFSGTVLPAGPRNISENQSSLLIKAASIQESMPVTNYKCGDAAQTPELFFNLCDLRLTAKSLADLQ